MRSSCFDIRVKPAQAPGLAVTQKNGKMMFSIFNNQTLAKVRRILAGSEGGIHKRIDENRELLELLQTQAPVVLHKYPWIEGWLRSQDNFLTNLSDAVQVEEPMFKPRQNFPRSWPLHKMTDTFQYNEERVMIGHEVVSMDKPSDGEVSRSVCGGHSD
jgi:hypothetical protein